MDSLIKRIERSFCDGWDMPAFTDYGTDLTYTYGDVATSVAYLHMLFSELGIVPGDKIAICAKNSSNWAVATLAVITYRAVLVPLLTDYTDEQLVMLCEHCDAKFVIGGERIRNLWPDGNCPMYLLDISNLTPSMTKDDGTEISLTERFAELYPKGFCKENVRYQAENPDDMMVLSYTSGSSGNPKGVMLPYRSMLSNNDYANSELRVKPGENLLFLLPMAHMFGFTFDFMHAVTARAHSFILTKLPAPSVLMEALKDVKPVLLLSVPLIMEKIVNGKIRPVVTKKRMRFLLKIPVLRRAILDAIRRQMLQAFGGDVRMVVLGGAGLNGEVERILRMVRFPYTVGFGMTECGPIISYADSKAIRFGSCGTAALHMEVKVLSSNPQRIPGEIVTRGMNLMLGYYKNRSATDEVIDQDGWLHTGDLGTIDNDGFLYIRGRKKNMILSSDGQNIYPEDIESQVLASTVFDECIVVQRDGKLVAMVYATDAALKAAGLKRAELPDKLGSYLKETNRHLPKYGRLATLELREEEFKKTPKKNIRRYLYK